MKLVFPEYLFWGLLLPLSLAAIVLIVRKALHALKTWFDPETYRMSLPRLKGVLRGFSLVLAFLALLGPYQSKQEQALQQAGREIFILLDVSASMRCKDIRPSRLHKAKGELRTLIEELNGDLVGLIVFADQAFVQCPLTRDHKALNLFLELAEPEQFAQSGTNFRQVLALALERFLSSDRPDRRTSRAIVLVSDGEDFGNTYTSVVNRLQEQGIPVFPVGIGTYEGAQVPQIVEGKRRGVKTTEEGIAVVSRLQDASLRGLANAFNTKFYPISASHQHLQNLAGDIRLLTATQLETRQEKVALNRYQYFLFAAFLLWFATLWIMPVRKS